MPGKYYEVHNPSNRRGPGDARPVALQIIQDDDLTHKFPDKVFLITGGSGGMGAEIGRALASTGAKVFLTVRDLKKGEATCASFLQPGRVELLEMDNMSLDSVRAAAKTFLKKSNKLNVLINNAGIMATPWTVTIDGFESQFGTNHLSHFLLFNLFKDTLLASSTPEFHSRVVNVASIGHHYFEVQFDNYSFSAGKDYAPWKGYGQSKTANIYMANEIENRFGAQGLHGLSLHPGAVWEGSGLQKHVPKEEQDSWQQIEGVQKLLKNVEQGAATAVLAAVGKEWEGIGRVYLEDCDLARPTWNGIEGFADWAFDKEKEKRLWVDSLRMVGLTE